jgi:hypothetical protein
MVQSRRKTRELQDLPFCESLLFGGFDLNQGNGAAALIERCLPVLNTTNYEVLWSVVSSLFMGTDAAVECPAVVTVIAQHLMTIREP